MFDVVTFGSAIGDIFLKLDKGSCQVLKNSKFFNNKAICFPLGSKIFIKDLIMTTGGGGTNTAAFFANQGFKVAYVGKVGDDKKGKIIIDELKNFKVYTGFIKKDKKYSTAYSVILSLPANERTILIQRGACHFMNLKDIPLQKLKTRWFYLAPLSGASAELFGPLVKFAKNNKIMIAANPGNSQINFGLKILKPILSKIDILILNQEEASLLTKISFQKEKEIFRKLDKLVPGIVIMTKGKKGVIVSDGKYLWKAGSPFVSVIEKTGAGDAFASGFVSGFIKSSDIAYSIQMGTANAVSCIQKTGAKKGLLKKGQWGSLSKVKVKKQKIS